VRLLIVGTPQSIGDEVVHRLRREGHHVERRANTDDLIGSVLTRGIHLLVAEAAVVPASDLLDLCRTLREETSALIILASAPTGPTPRILALRAGADDYLTLPLDPGEFAARIEAHLRRHPLNLLGSGSVQLKITANLTLDLAGQRLLGPTGELSLSEHEFRLLLYLVRREGVVSSREALLNAAWGHEYEGEAREVDSYIHLLRRKLEPDPRHPRHLLTVWGRGYVYRGIETKRQTPLAAPN
jgi:two-component system OmpR family response regulator